MDEQIEPSSSPARLVSSSTHFQKVILWAAATFFASQILLFFAVAIIFVAALPAAACASHSLACRPVSKAGHAASKLQDSAD